MIYENYYWGMNFIWWIIWGIILFWIFALPYDIPGQRYSKETALSILKRRFAAGQLNEDQYQARKAVLDRQ